MQEKLYTADSQTGVGRDRQVVLACTLTDDACRPSLLEQQLVPAVALKDQPLQLNITIVRSDSQVKRDLLHRTNVGERQSVVKACNNTLGAGLQRKSGLQYQCLSAGQIVTTGRLQQQAFERSSRTGDMGR